MTIAPIAVGDSGETYENKINAAIAKANLVDGKANASDLAAETNARVAAIDGEEAAREAGDAALTTQIAARLAPHQAVAPIRPGEGPGFTQQLDGEPGALTPLPSGLQGVGADGRIVVMAGAMVVAPLQAWRVEPGRVYRVRFAFRRTIDTSDPANDAVRLALRWLAADKSGLSDGVLADVLDLTVADGRQAFGFLVGAAEAESIDLSPPTGAIYARPFLQTFGSGTTQAEVIEMADITDIYQGV